MEKICIIIPVYNAEKYLEKCIDSILSQSLREFRLILVNDGSKDGSLEICRQYERSDERILVLSQENNGAAAARNAGIDWALNEEKAEIIGFIDSDDWVHPDYLLRLHEGMCESECKISVCNSFSCNTRDAVFPTEVSSFEICSPEYLWCHDRTLGVVPWGKLYRADLFDTIRFPEWAKAEEDEFVSFRVLFSCDNIYYIHDRMYIYYQSEESVMRAEWTPKRMVGFDAEEEQLSFFYENGYREALHAAANTYAYSLHSVLKEIEKSIQDEEYQKCAVEIKKRLHSVIKRYFETYKFPMKGNEWVYALEHPVIARILLRFRGLERRVKRFRCRE